MAITDEQLEERKKFLGSSDIAALFTDDDGKSLNPFASAMDVWALKAHKLRDSGTSTKSQSIGHRYEPVLIEFAETELGILITTNPDKLRFICKEHPIFACNLDGFIEYNQADKENEIVEAKTTGLVGEWGEPGTDDVPFRTILQVHQQMLCTGWKKAHIVVLLGKWGLREEMYVVERDEKIIEAIIERGEQFWNDYVLTKTPPPDSEPGRVNVFKCILRVPDKYAPVSVDTIRAWDDARQAYLDAGKAKDNALATLLAELGDAEGAHYTNEKEFTFFESSRKGIDSKRLKLEFPVVYAALEKITVSRTARLRKV